MSRARGSMVWSLGMHGARVMSLAAATLRVSMTEEATSEGVLRSRLLVTEAECAEPGDRCGTGSTMGSWRVNRGPGGGVSSESWAAAPGSARVVVVASALRSGGALLNEMLETTADHPVDSKIWYREDEARADACSTVKNKNKTRITLSKNSKNERYH